MPAGAEPPAVPPASRSPHSPDKRLSPRAASLKVRRGLPVGTPRQNSAADDFVEDVEIGPDIRRRSDDHHLREELRLIIEYRMRKVALPFLLEDFERSLIGQRPLVFLDVRQHVL